MAYHSAVHASRSSDDLARRVDAEQNPPRPAAERCWRRRRNGLNPWRRQKTSAQALGEIAEPAVELDQQPAGGRVAAGVPVKRPWHWNLYRKQPFGPDAGLHAIQPQERAREETRGHQQRDCQCDLRNHEATAQPAHPGSRRGPTGIAHHFNDVDTRELPGRQDSEQHGGGERYQHREPDHMPVECDVLQIAVGRERGVDERAQANPRDGDTDHAGPKRQQHVFSQQLPQDPRARRSERGTDAELLLANERLRQQQSGNVGARNQQQQKHRALQHENRLPQVTDGRLAQ